MATAVLKAAIWSAVKVVAEPKEDGSAIWSRRALYLPVWLTAGLLISYGEAFYMLMFQISNGFSTVFIRL